MKFLICSLGALTIAAAPALAAPSTQDAAMLKLASISGCRGSPDFESPKHITGLPLANSIASSTS